VQVFCLDIVLDQKQKDKMILVVNFYLLEFWKEENSDRIFLEETHLVFTIQLAKNVQQVSLLLWFLPF